ncbi:hypothetical protein [Burkholderia plantarii]|uniref:hypothetical protein n=1 Tax=Burkholderia plantarii TaxID=41899 RepID=UPI0018DB653D|nr:hypothetical protein [Burkholderia plantarii]MBI0327560.1 hypothetical protein [Burkholderia plantarii]
MAKEITSDPQWKAKVSKDVSGLTTSWYQRIPVVGRLFGGAPQNEEATSAWARLALQDYYQRNPTASADQAKQWVQQQVQTNFVYDPVNKVDLQVPPNQANNQTQEAIQNYIQKARQQYGEEMNPGLIYGGDGKYTLSAFINGAPVHKLADVSFDQIIQQTASTKLLSSDELGAMSALKQKLNAGTATSQDLIDNAQLLAKARADYLGKRDRERTASRGCR